MQARLRSVKGLVRSAQYMMRSKPSVRLFATSSTPASAVYEHMSNMKTQDLFQFEPFNNADLVNFPREAPGKDYSLNWALANEWFTVWGNAYRNPCRSVLRTNSKGEMDANNNAVCARDYIPSGDVKVSKEDFADLSDSVKEFLSQVPNLYVEDAAVCSGRCAELRIRSVTNDPVAAMAMKNMLHCMPKRDPMTPHPLSVIIARGMEESFTAIGMDPHSKALTVIATGDTPMERILEEVSKAASQQMDAARGTIEVTVPASEPDKPATKVSKKGAVVQSVVRGGVVMTKEGQTVLVCGLGMESALQAMNNGSLFCSNNAVVTKDGLSRVFAGELVEAAKTSVQDNIIVNGQACVPVPADNLAEFPSKVVFVGEKSASALDEVEAAKRMEEFCCCEETAKFTVSMLKKNGAEFVCADAASVQSLF